MRGNQVLPVNISRGTIPVPSVDAAYMITPSTGFIHINKFAESTYREFMMSLEKLKAQNMQKLAVCAFSKLINMNKTCGWGNHIGCINRKEQV